MTIKGLVFDKDGTLFHYGGTWATWCDLVLADLANGDVETARALALAVGYEPDAREFLAGSLVVGASAGEINQSWADLLPNHSFEDVDAVAVNIYTGAAARLKRQQRTHANSHKHLCLGNDPVDLPGTYTLLSIGGHR